MDIPECDLDVYLGVRRELCIMMQVKIGCAKWLPGLVEMLQGGDSTVSASEVAGYRTQLGHLREATGEHSTAGMSDLFYWTPHLGLLH